MARHHRRVFADGLDDRDAFIDVLTTEMGFRQRPAVVIVEDLQWADHASLDIVGFLGRRVHALPALLVVSYRDDDVPDNEPLQRLLGSLAGPSTTRIHLDGLSDACGRRTGRRRRHGSGARGRGRGRQSLLPQ